MYSEHTYKVKVKWTGNTGTGTSGYSDYRRAHVISAAEKEEPIKGSSDTAFRGDPTRYNPEELLTASLSSCHMLWFLHLCADAKVIVLEYVDEPVGVMIETRGAGGQFSEVTLYPRVTVKSEGMLAQLDALHEQAHKLCFIANSVNFEVKCVPSGKAKDVIA